jgi:ABC-type enterochelin transport system permease subunit
MNPEMIEQLQEMGSQMASLGTVIWAKMVMLTWAESVAYLVAGGISALIAIVCWIIFGRTMKTRESSYDYSLGMIVSGIIAAITTLSAAVNLLYPWNWVGAFVPEARLIARLIGAATGSN